MPGLGNFRFQFDSCQSFPNGESRCHPPLARTTLPALHELIFEGVNEYFEDLVARIDTPLIRKLEITLFHRPFYEFSQLSRFIGRAEVFKSPAHANISLSYSGAAEVSLSLGTRTDRPAPLLLRIWCEELHLRLRYFVQVCSSSLLPFSKVESLAISSKLDQSQWGATAEDFPWLDLLRPFTAVEVLHIGRNSLTPVAYTLKTVVKERITEMFPAIRELSIGGHLPSRPVLMAIEEFATTRGLLTRLYRPHRWIAG
ncbi:hypothetical protein BGY98DRAFT_1028752 [Russula aff. rugulosa BPL654]|nr:hypothetical protein BGY98DRAFT_1028752 [Russula aff. rugulosa BPL654]